MMDALLTTELIPRSAHGINLRAAATKAQWETIKRLTVARAGGHCEICGAHATPKHPLETHEDWNWDEAMRVQSLVRTVALCHWCHRAKHPGMTQKLGLTAPMHRHMMLVNSWTPEELIAHTKDAWREWVRLSYIKWVFEPNLSVVISQLGG